jgi:hypothetical protein
MMFDPHDGERPDGPRPPTDRELTWIISFCGLFFGLVAVEIFGEYAPRKLAAVWFCAAWIPLTILHEGAHALVAAALRWRVLRVVVGVGPVIWSRTIRGVPVELRVLPLSGFVVPIPRTADGAGWRSSLIYLAGPGVEILVVVAIAALLGDALLVRTDAHGPIALQAVAAAATTGAVMNLIPVPFPNGGVSDGLGAILGPFRPREAFEAQIREHAAQDRSA